jgi:hypothetical protein
MTYFQEEKKKGRSRFAKAKRKVEIKLWDLLSQGEMIPHLVWFIKNQTYLSERGGNEINNGKAMFWSDVW